MPSGSPTRQQFRDVTAKGMTADGMVRFLSKPGLPATIIIRRGLSAEERAVFTQAAGIIKARRWRIIYHQGQSPQGLFLLEHGKIRLSQRRRGGTEQELAILEPGAMFGDLLLLGQVAHRASA